MMMKIGIIGGSGLYEMADLEKVPPFGRPSAPLVQGELGGMGLVFLPRHGRGHTLMPAEINYRANIYALKQLGVGRILSISAVGSMKEEIRPGDLVLVDQFIDRTSGRESTFFGGGVVAHVPLADPVCPEMRQALARCCRQLDIRFHPRGTYICINGPQFSTRAESNLYRRWGVDVIGMTNMPEARLAREAQICYATLALATDYDCWKEDHDDVTIEAVLAIVRQNVENSQRVIRRLATELPAAASCACGRALADTILTDPQAITAAARERLGLIFPDGG
ncbi:MAG: S-methyl-5'-thioadenosine phosphorylase [Deltaproteobacteria bacterium]|nr:S-methyl-5'-thioadenosine phosphorylase [Deltaproteobacteria bacterium]